jgi:hypothetical protein
LREEFDYLAMTQNGRRFLRAAIDVDGVIAAFAGEIHSRGFQDVGSDRAASSGRERFTQDIGTAQRFFGQFAIRLQNHLDRFLQVCARFLQRRALRIRAGQFLHECGVAFGKFSEDRCQLDFHVDLVARNARAGQLPLF